KTLGPRLRGGDASVSNRIARRRALRSWTDASISAIIARLVGVCSARRTLYTFSNASHAYDAMYDRAQIASESVSSAPVTSSFRKDLANAIRALAMDAVQAANSGHPGMPMGMAEIALALWNRHLRHNPGNPHWYDRDRFVVSNGHGSMLLYALLHLTGYDLPMQDLKNFRQLHSKTPGHP